MNTNWHRFLSSFKILSFALTAFAVQALHAAPPEEGLVVEGVMVPGILIGDSKATVETAYGSPSFCQGPEQDYCTYTVSGVGSVNINYVGPDGGESTGTSSDIVHSVSWYGYPGWFTNEGITTEIALANPQAVIDAYPNGEVVYNMFGDIFAVRDYDLGISVFWHRNFETGTVAVAIQIFESIDIPDPDPEPELDTLEVSGIDLSSKRRNVSATVNIVDSDGSKVSGAVVSIQWTFPNGSTQSLSSSTNKRGQAKFSVSSQRGTHTVSIVDVSKSGYELDVEGSAELEDSIFAKR